MQHKQIWKKLKQFLIDKQEYVPGIPKLDLFPKEETEDFVTYFVAGHPIKQTKEKQLLDKQALKNCNENAIDNTGSYYWPSEYILTNFIHENRDLLQPNVVELGSGKSGFCGLFLERLGYHVTITDGNENTVLQLQANLKANNSKAESSVLQWGDGPKFEQTTAVLADCFFFEKYHDQLLLMLRRFTNVIAAAPSRGGSLERFLQKCADYKRIDYMQEVQIILLPQP